MRFDNKAFAGLGPLDLAERTVERAGGFTQVLAPRDWTGTRVEAWLDWADELAADYPDASLVPESLGADGGVDPLLGGGPDRYARRAAARGLAAGLFDCEQDALAFRDGLFASLVHGLAAPAAVVALSPVLGAEDDLALAAHLADMRRARTAQAAVSARPRRLFISGWMRVPNCSMPIRKSSKVSMTPRRPGISASSSSRAATVA